MRCQVSGPGTVSTNSARPSSTSPWRISANARWRQPPRESSPPGSGRPGSAKVRLRSASGWRSAASSATRPPREWPTKWAGPLATVSMNSSTSLACCSIEKPSPSPSHVSGQ
ncbi:hypothetical protein G6F52_013966 [Rhizopus delemar]|nr:hypothetical protein G6F52_013966 [Rhizopus delemar]